MHVNRKLGNIYSGVSEEKNLLSLLHIAFITYLLQPNDYLYFIINLFSFGCSAEKIENGLNVENGENVENGVGKEN